MLKDIFNFINTTPNKKTNSSKNMLLLNGEKIDDLIVESGKLHYETYKILRNIKTPIYGHAWLMKKKKGFNTTYFISCFDVVICDKFGNIIDMFNNLEPGYVSHYYKDAYFIYFLIVGSIKFYDFKLNSRLTLHYKKPSLEIFADAVGI